MAQTTKTVKVRIAVAVTPDGDWNATGWRDGDDDKKMGLAIDPLDGDAATYFVECELPIPQSVTVQGKVVE